MCLKAKSRIYKLTPGVTPRIFRLIETATEDAARSSQERLDANSCDDNLVLPLVLMTKNVRTRGKRVSQPIGAP